MLILPKLDGLLAEGNADALAALAARVQPHLAILEIGAFRGASTVALSLGAKSGLGAKVYSVDPWDLPGNPYGKHGYSAPETRLRYDAQLRRHRVRTWVTTIQAFSTDAAADWSGPEIGLLVIDGDHTERGVRDDVSAWAPHLATMAVMAFDDYGTKPNPGVAVVVDELAESGLWRFRLEGSTLAVLEPA